MGLLDDFSEGEIKRDWFPKFDQDVFLRNQTSEASEDYNCFAWAGGDQTQKWDWTGVAGRHWPKEIELTGEIESFIDLYLREGSYTPCSNGDLESGFEKIALYVGLDNEVKHAARQLHSGLWTSKLGDYEDIQHELEFLEGGAYGWVRVFLKRSVKT